MGWLRDERLVFVLDDTSVLVFNVLGHLLKQITLGEVININI